MSSITIKINTFLFIISIFCLKLQSYVMATLEIIKKKVRILMAILHFFKRPPLSNGLQSDLDQQLYMVY